MKIAAVIVILLSCNTLFAQPENEAIKKPIIGFFAGMKSNDTTAISAVLDPACFLYTVTQDKAGATILQKENMSDFLIQIASLKEQDIDEQLLSYDIKADGAMAVAWTPYKLYFNKKFYHCGVNVFTLIKRNGLWKIMGITDTRRKEGCE